MGCHNGSRSTDFVWALPLNMNGSAEHAFSRNRQSALEQLRAITGWDRR
jgi:hypothetical protein